MKKSDFEKWLMGLDELTARQKWIVKNEVKSAYYDPAANQWKDSDSPTTEFRAMTSF